MRIFAIFALVVASVAAKGSGPYLPSGWKPKGPAFYLPAEIEVYVQDLFYYITTQGESDKETVFQESEASGSDSFQEYGPPKVQEVSQELSKQGLPDAVTELAFAAIELKVEQNEEKEVAVTEGLVVIEESEAKLSLQSDVEEIVPGTEGFAFLAETTTVAEPEVIVENIEIQPAVEITTQLAYEASTIAVDTKEVTVQQGITDIGSEQVLVNETQEKIVEETQEENENANSDIVSTFQQKIKEEEVQTVKEEVQKVETEVKTDETEAQEVKSQAQNLKSEVNEVVQVVQNIPELLNNIDNEIKKQQAENIQEISEARAILETFGSLEQAEGFLEYGPPGFKEYGPPKDELLRATDEKISSDLQSIEINETRKRRFSPKLRVARKVNKH